jgi:hypothetical protein
MKSQNAYQKSRSTEAALQDLVQKIDGSLNQKEFVLRFFWMMMEHLNMRPLAQWMRQAVSIGFGTKLRLVDEEKDLVIILDKKPELHIGNVVVWWEIFED